MKDWAIVTFLAAGIALFQWWALPEHNSYSADHIWLVAGAQSLASGHGYRMPYLEGNPPIGLYPPGQSLFLAASWWICPRWPQVQVWLKGQMIALFALTMGAMFLLLRRSGVSIITAALVTITVGGNGAWAYEAMNCYPDIPFACLGFLACWLWIGPASITFGLRMAFTGILLATMYLFRTAALGFLPGALLAAVAACRDRRQWRFLALLVLPVAFAVLGWALAPKGTLTYGAWVGEQWQRFDYLNMWFSYFNGYHWGYAFTIDTEQRIKDL